MLIDTHAHINDERLKEYAKSIALNMRADDLLGIVNVGFDYASSLLAVEQARELKGVWACIGIHPHDAVNAEEKHFEHFRVLAKSNDKVLAIGECGLDYYYDFSPRDKQKEVFVESLRLANEVGLPVSMHCRDAYSDMLDILRCERDLIKNGGVMHCYGGSKEMSRHFLDLGLYLSFGGVITFKNALKSCEVLQNAPKDRVLLETDCPYLTPEPFRGRLNYPKYVGLVAKRLANLWQLSYDEVKEITTNNAKAFFNSDFLD